MTENRSSQIIMNALKWFSATDFMDDSGSVPDSIFYFAARMGFITEFTALTALTHALR